MLGFNWDSEKKAWWTAKKKRAEDAASTITVYNDSTVNSDTKIVGKATYGGKTYLVLWEGAVRNGKRRAKLASMDGSKIFWAETGEYRVTKVYQEMTFGHYQSLREYYVRDKANEAVKDDMVGKMGSYVRFTEVGMTRPMLETVNLGMPIFHEGVEYVLVGAKAMWVSYDSSQNPGYKGWILIHYYDPKS